MSFESLGRSGISVSITGSLDDSLPKTSAGNTASSPMTALLNGNMSVRLNAECKFSGANALQYALLDIPQTS